MKAQPSTEAKRPSRLPYYRDRNDRLVSFVVSDLDVKAKMRAAAEKDNRSLNSWLITHCLPLIEQEADRQLNSKNK